MPLRHYMNSAPTGMNPAPIGINIALIGVLLISPTLAWANPLSAQYGAVDGEWRVYGGDGGHTQYTALDQIDAGNVGTSKSPGVGPRRTPPVPIFSTSSRRRS